MVRKGKFIIGKSKSRLRLLEQRILGYNRQLTKLNTKVDLISAWISKKFGVSFLVETSARVKLVDLSKHLAVVKSTALPSVNPGVKKAKQRFQSVSVSGGQDSGSDVSTESDVMVDSDSDVTEADKDAEIFTVGDPVDGRIPLEDGAPEREGRIPGQRKNKFQRNKMARLQLGAINGRGGNATKEQRPRTTLAPAPEEGRLKHYCNWPNCDKYFSSMHSCTIHHRTHTGVKPFKCSFSNCGKSFISSTERTKHCRTHTGEKPYICNWPDCDKSFAQSGTLQLHRRTHTGERPFKCGFCDYQCTQSSTLTIHTRIHTAEKPYKCRVCSATFTQSGNKDQHEKIHRKSH